MLPTYNNATNANPTGGGNGELWKFIASGVASAAQAVGGWFTGKKNREFNKEEAEKAYKRNMNAWHLQNEYNAPSQQMARLKAAGLNPNMVYGTGTQAAGTAGSAPRKEATTSNIQAPKGDAISNYLMLKQGQLLDAQKRKVGAEEHYTKVNTERLIQEMPNIAKRGNLTDQQAEATRQQAYNTAQLRSNLKQTNLNQKTQGQILTLQKSILNKEWINFRDYDIPQNAPAYMKSFMGKVKEILGSGDSIREVTTSMEAEIHKAWERMLHLSNIGLGTNFDTRWNN